MFAGKWLNCVQASREPGWEDGDDAPVSLWSWMTISQRQCQNSRYPWTIKEVPETKTRALSGAEITQGDHVTNQFFKERHCGSPKACQQTRRGQNGLTGWPWMSSEGLHFLLICKLEAGRWGPQASSLVVFIASCVTPTRLRATPVRAIWRS